MSAARARHDSHAGPAAGAISLAEALARSEQWSDLDSASLTRSVFVEPGMLAAAAGTIEAGDWEVLRVTGHDTQLDALAVFHRRPVLPVVGPVVAEFFHSHYGPRSTPLLRADADDPAGRLIEALAPLSPVAKLSFQALDDAATRALIAAAARRGLAVVITDEHERAFLDATIEPEAAVGPGFKKRRMRELGRQWRKLAAEQPIDHQVCRAPADVRTALDAFIRIEAASWKGRQGTALASRPERTDFARRFIGTLADAGRVRADVISFAGKPSAVLLTLFAGSRGFLWKITHSEEIAFASPGVQLVRRATEDFLADPSVTDVDSLATANHNLMDRLWSGRQRMGTLFLATTPAANGQAMRAATLHRILTATKDGLRSLKHRLQG